MSLKRFNIFSTFGTSCWGNLKYYFTSYGGSPLTPKKGMVGDNRVIYIFQIIKYKMKGVLEIFLWCPIQRQSKYSFVIFVSVDLELYESSILYGFKKTLVIKKRAKVFIESFFFICKTYQIPYYLKDLFLQKQYAQIVQLVDLIS